MGPPEEVGPRVVYWQARLLLDHVLEEGDTTEADFYFAYFDDYLDASANLHVVGSTASFLSHVIERMIAQGIVMVASDTPDKEQPELRVLRASSGHRSLKRVPCTPFPDRQRP